MTLQGQAWPRLRWTQNSISQHRHFVHGEYGARFGHEDKPSFYKAIDEDFRGTLPMEVDVGVCASEADAVSAAHGFEMGAVP